MKHLIYESALLQVQRSSLMDQKELEQRVGLGRNTISSMENGKGVNSGSLFQVLEHLDLIDDIQWLVEQKLNSIQDPLSRKSRKPPLALDNDF